jgi:predicted alpha/beta hydrolase family esterase
VAEVRRVGVDLDDDDLVLVAHGVGVVALHVAARRLDVVRAGITMLTSRSGVADGV